MQSFSENAKTFEPHGIFDQILHTYTFYLYILTLFRHWIAQGRLASDRSVVVI